MLRKKRSGSPDARKKLGVQVDTKTAYLKRKSERLALPEADLASLQQGLVVRNAMFETEKELRENLICQAAGTDPEGRRPEHAAKPSCKPRKN